MLPASLFTRCLTDPDFGSYFQGLKNLRLEKYEDRVELTVDTDWDTYS